MEKNNEEKKTEPKQESVNKPFEEKPNKDITPPKFEVTKYSEENN